MQWTGGMDVHLTPHLHPLITPTPPIWFTFVLRTVLLDGCEVITSNVVQRGLTVFQRGGLCSLCDITSMVTKIHFN